MSGKFKCSECNKEFKHGGFKRLYDLRKHAKKFHQEQLDQIAPLKKHCDGTDQKVYNFSCDVCQKNFNYKHHLTFHKKIHGVSTNFSKSTKKCPLCSFRNSSKDQLYSHFKDDHNIEVFFENFEFSTKENFEAWKNSTEQSSKSRFVKEHGSKSRKNLSYICHRSGFYISEGRNKRHLKTQGTRKIGGFCPSAMKVLVNSDGQYRVTYIKTHVGHTADLGHLDLTKAEKQEIAAKISQKIPFSQILDEVRDKVTENSIQRIHLLTRRDLHNISTAFHLQSESVRHSNDTTSIESWVNDMHHGQCVLFYKPQGVSSNEHPKLKSEDFILIIMNEGQSQILKQFSADCICIDNTDGLNTYNFELHTLLVLDDQRQGFPTAFLISNRSDQEVMTLFFSCIKEKIGFAISPKVFMSDMPEAYYNAWKIVMNKADFHLFCTWHVDRTWRENLNLINTKDKQAETYKSLRTLLQETDETTFLTILEEFLMKSSKDPDTSKFSTYFNENYRRNVKSWAYCYRLHSGLNTNMHLERMHKAIKYIYLEGKHVKRLDKSLSCIMKFVKDKLFDRIITLNKGKIYSKLKDLQKRHKKSVELDVNLIGEVNDGWQVFSSTSQVREIYEIHKNVEQCECQLVCPDCKICIHKYSCSCIDSCIRWNMCKHIHLLGRKMLDQDQLEIDGNENLHIHIDPRNAETEDIYKTLVTTCSSDPLNSKALGQNKEEIKKWFSTLVDSIHTDSHFRVLTKLVATIEPTLKATVVRDRLDRRQSNPDSP